MFDVFPKALASVASFLFPVFASYKALKTADPAQLTPWLMYWVVLACVLLVESWTDWLLVWVPFYHYFRLLFLLYLVLPQTQGARLLYQDHVHPWIAEHEARIDEFIGSAHARMRSAGMHYLKQAIAYLRTVLGLPVAQEAAAESASTNNTTPQSYTQALLARFTLPSARWPGGAATGAPSGSQDSGTAPGTTDFYNLLATAVGALGTATGAAGGAAASAFASATSARAASSEGGAEQMTASGTLVPPTVREADRASFLATQRDRLRTLLSALEREAAQLEETDGSAPRTSSSSSPLSRPLSGASGLSKSRSEADFEKIDAESGAEEDGQRVRRRRQQATATGNTGADGADTSSATPGAAARTTSGSWMPWGWGGGGGGANPAGGAGEAGASSSAEK